MDENLLILNCQKGDSASFGPIFDAYYRKIYSFVYFRVQHKATAEDLVSEIFSKALEKISQYQPAMAKFSTWLYQIAKNTITNYFRKVKSTENIEDVWEIASNSNIERDADVVIALEQIKQAMEKLPALQRDILVMRLWDDLSHKEIAEILEISEGNSKVSFKRALEKLKIAIGQNLLISLLLFKHLKDML